MARPRNKVQRQLDRESVARLTLQGWLQSDIAQYLEIDQSTISRDLKAIQQQWKESAIRDFDLDRQQELQRLALIEKELWQAWAKSQLPKEGSAIHSTSGDERLRIATKSEQRVGDVNFLAGILKVIDIRARLLGLSLPQQGTSLHEDRSIDFSGLSISELRAIAAG